MPKKPIWIKIAACAVLAASVALPAPASALQADPPGAAQAPAAGELVLNSTWLLERADAPKNLDAGGPRQLAVDDGGNLNVVYGGDFLYYAYKPTGGPWQLEVVDNGDNRGGVGAYASVAVDSFRMPHVAYYDSYYGGLKYAFQSCDEYTCWWNTSYADNNRMYNVGLYPSIAVDGLGGIHIAYYDASNANMLYAYKANGSSVWSKTVAHSSADDVGRSPSLALNGNTPCIAYLNNSTDQVLFTCKSGSVFGVPETVASFAGSHVALAIGGGYYQVAYQSQYVNSEYDCDFNYNITHAWKSVSGGSWSESDMILTDICESGAYPFRGFGLSLTLESSGLPRFVYFDHLDDSLYYVGKDSITGGTASWDEITHFAVNSNIDIYNTAAIYQNTPHLVYQIHDYSIHHAWGSGVPNNQEVIDTYGTPVGSGSALAAKGGTLHVAYLQGSDLLYRYRTSTGWSDREVVDDWVYIKPAMAVGSVPHLVYFQDGPGTDEEVSYAHRLCFNLICGWPEYGLANGAWYTNQFNIALDSTGKAYTVYKNPATDQVVLRSGSFTNWSGETPIGQGGQYINEYAEVAVDSTDHVHVVFTDAFGGLFYRSNTLGFWSSIETIASSLGTPVYAPNDLTLYMDLPRVAFYNKTTGWLMYAPRFQGSWSPEPVVNLGPGYTDGFSIAVGLKGEPYIAYYDPVEKDLMLASKPAGSWVFKQIDIRGDVGQYPDLAVDQSGLKRISYHDASNGDLKVAMEQARVLLPVVLR